MFYDRFIKLCKEHGEKPTPLLRRLKLSPGNLSKWQNGGNVSSGVLITLCNYFGVSMNYFFVDELKEECLHKDIEEENILEFVIMGQRFYRGLKYDELNDAFLNKVEVFDFLPNDKELLIEKAEICGIDAKVKVTFKDDVLVSVYITAIGGSDIRRSGHRFILKRFFGEPNSRNENANVYYEYPDLTAGDYITANNSIYIDIVFGND